MLAAATWSGDLIFWPSIPVDYTGLQNLQVQQQKTPGPILGLCWQEDAPALLIAHSDNSIMKWDLQSNQLSVIGKHDGPVKDIASFTNQGTSIVVSAGWDAKVKFWTWQGPTQL